VDGNLRKKPAGLGYGFRPGRGAILGSVDRARRDRRTVAITLDAEWFALLERRAAENDRIAHQEASFIVKQVLRTGHQSPGLVRTVADGGPAPATTAA
jgi:hypothetical protein